MKLAQIIEKTGGELHPPCEKIPDITITGIAPVDKASPGELTFQTNPRYAGKVASTKATAIFLGKPTDQTTVLQIIHPNPYAAMAMTAQMFFTRTHTFQGQSDLAFIHPEAQVDPEATLYPFAYIDKGARVGSGSVLYPHTYLGENSSVGKNTVLYPGVSVMYDCEIGNSCLIHSGCVIGADGFGFAPDKSGNVKIPQVAKAIIEDDVELQAGCTIDRGALEDTIVGSGTKLDDQVLIAHGVQLGKNCLIAGQGAIAGSTKIGDRFIMAGCGAIGPSLTVASDVLVGPKAGINAPIEKSGEYHGFPAIPARQWRKETVSQKRLPDLIKQVQSLQKRIEELENR